MSDALPISRSSAVTHGIQVDVAARFVPEQSTPERGEWFFAYQITISNLSDRTVQLVSREWRITDATGQTQRVHGPGVVGEQPVLEPGDSFEYTSGTPLSTPSGIMVGDYGMETAEGQRFTVAIPAFSLDSEFDRHSVN